ncbi:MAG: four helix bundle protein [Deltaproteobacteria bacterium]|nr:four helix bundle protein [Deltaproteobacteria bacterium]
MKDFRELKIWEKSHKLSLCIYKITKDFPKEELYGLTSQIRRACTSIATNIAEGCGRDSDAELHRFLVIAMGSASEVEYLLLLSNDLNLIHRSNYLQLNEDIIEIKRMLGSFIQKLKADR